MTADASRVRAALTAWADAVQTGAVDDVPDMVRPLAPLGTSTPTSTRAPGELRNSITVAQRVTSNGTSFRGRVAATAPQARWTDRGTDPHEIVPRGPGYPLRFWSARAGVIVFRWRVFHPGNAAQNWWEPAVRSAFVQSMLTRARSTPFR